MSSDRLRRVAALVSLPAVALFAATCVTSTTRGPDRAARLNSMVAKTDPRNDAKPSPFDADPDQLLRVGDFEAAHAALVRERSRDGATPELEERIRTASVLAAKRRASLATRALSAGRLAEARQHVQRATELEPELAAVRRARQQIGPRLAAAEEAERLRNEAKRLLAIDPARAVDLLVLAREKDPDDPIVIGLLQAATLRAEAERGTARATAAWEAGDRDAVVLALLDARYRGKPVGSASKLIRRIERELEAALDENDPAAARQNWEFGVRVGVRPFTLQALRAAATKRMLQQSETLLAAGRTATAAMLELDAQRMGVDRATPALDLIRRRASVEVVVFPFEDATDGDVDGLRVARMLADRIRDDSRQGGLAITVLGPGPDAAKLAETHPRALRLHATARSSYVNRSRVGRSVEKVKVQVGTKAEPTPEMGPLVQRLHEVQEQYRIAQEEQEDARDELRQIVDMPFIHPTKGGRSRLGEAYYAELLRRARERARRADRELQRVGELDRAVREQVRAADGHIEIPVYGERERTVETHSISADITVAVTLEDADGMLLEQTVTGSVRHRETVAPGFPDFHVAPDRDESPDDAEMARRAAEHFAGLTSGLVRLRAEKAARHFLADARDAEKAGREAEAAEAYALYLLATPEVATPQRAAAAEAFEDLTGTRVPLHTGLVRGHR